MSSRLSNLIKQLDNDRLNKKEDYSFKFKYTVSKEFLSEKERFFYEENGFILRKKFLNSYQVKKYNDRFEKLCENPSERAKQMLIMRDVTAKNTELKDKKKLRQKSDIVKLQDWQNDKILMEYAKNSEILKIVSAFIGDDIHSIHTMYINKPPDKGSGSSRHPPHQDLWYFPFRPADRIVASWSALEVINEKNGCLYVIPGSHKSNLLKHSYPSKGGMVNKAYHKIKGFDVKTVDNLIPLDMDPGDTIFFHPLLFHGSGPNYSKNFRRAISTHFAGGQCHQIKVNPKSIQWSIKKESEEMAIKQKFGYITYHQIWQLKSRCIKGKRGLNTWGLDTDD